MKVLGSIEDSDGTYENADPFLVRDAWVVEQRWPYLGGHEGNSCV